MLLELLWLFHDATDFHMLFFCKVGSKKFDVGILLRIFWSTFLLLLFFFQLEPFYLFFKVFPFLYKLGNFPFIIILRIVFNEIDCALVGELKRFLNKRWLYLWIRYTDVTFLYFVLNLMSNQSNQIFCFLIIFLTILHLICL